MNSEKLTVLKNGKIDEIEQVLQDFNTENASVSTKTDLEANDVDLWLDLWRQLFCLLNNDAYRDLHVQCLNAVRILTRNKECLQKHNVSEDIVRLMELAHLTPDDITVDAESYVNAPDVSCKEMCIIIEALKCLCNLVYQTMEYRRTCLKHHLLDSILKSVASPVQYPTLVEFFQMKLLFLLTALEPKARTRVQIDLNGSIHMTEWLDEKLKEMPLSNEQLELLSEILKVLLNISCSPDKSPSPNDNEIQSLHLTCVLRELLLTFGELNTPQERQVVCDAINLMTNIASSCLTELMLKCDSTTDTVNKHMLQFEGFNVQALNVLLNYLHSALLEQENSASSQENISPVLLVLIKCARCHSVMRHFIRSVVLPPLRDVSQRPEVGHELRNCLCRFLTSPSQILRSLSSELLFVLCKENVGRMIKYTGYGNAAGLFASRGLLDCRVVENTEYSSDSEDSDTDEYKQQQHGINPVVGCFEPPRRNPLEGMSEEQKEYEAMQLVQLMDKLHRSGVMQPCRIGEDGKPQPVEHILQLQEELPQQQFEQKPKT